MLESLLAVFALTCLAALYVLHRRTRRMQRLMNDHLNADYEHLQVTDELMQRVADLDGKGLPKVVRESIE